MFEARKKPSCRGTAATILLLVLVWTWVRPAAVYGQQQKNPVVPRAAGAAETTTTVSKPPDFSNVVFPPPPAIARVKYLDYFSAEKPQPLTATKKAKKKRSWMDRMAGTSAIDTQTGESKPRFQLIQPYGLAVDSLPGGNLLPSRLLHLVLRAQESRRHRKHLPVRRAADNSHLRRHVRKRSTLPINHRWSSPHLHRRLLGDI